jgi:hypothetical protein
MGWVGDSAVSKRVSCEQVAELVVNLRIRPGIERDEGTESEAKRSDDNESELRTMGERIDEPTHPAQGSWKSNQSGNPARDRESKDDLRKEREE